MQHSRTSAHERLNIASGATNIETMSENHPCRKFHITLRSLAVPMTNRYTERADKQQAKAQGLNTHLCLVAVSKTMHFFYTVTGPNLNTYFVFLLAMLTKTHLSLPPVCQIVRRNDFAKLTGMKGGG